MPSDEILQQIRQTIREAVEGSSSLPASLRCLFYIPLEHDGKILSNVEHSVWSDLVIATAQATKGSLDAAITVAASVEVFIASLDVLDEIEDHDDSPTAAVAGEARALNVATALLFLAQLILLRLPASGVAINSINDFVRTLNEAGLAATGGQHLDLSAEDQEGIAQESALDIARQKAGSLAAGACRLGALLGTADEVLLDRYTELGNHFGTIGQLRNDLHDASNVESKSDQRRKKATLPLLFHQHHQTNDANDDAASGQARLAQSGALSFAWVVLETERQHCARLLNQLASDGQDVSALRALLA